MFTDKEIKEIEAKSPTLDTTNFSEEELEKEIWACEARLQELRTAYMKKTGHAPIRGLTDYSWRWTIFMALGFAFISSMVFLLGIRHTGSALDTGIPSFFFETDFAYFAIMTFFVILLVLTVQLHKINGIQALSLLLGYWCAHWLIYDWSWHAIKIGFGLNDMSTFWTTSFGYDLLIVRPQMWFFLTEAFIGACMALYIFTVPKSYKELLPPIIWLFAAYMNAELLQLFEVGADVIFITGMTFLCVAIGLLGYFTFQRLRNGSFPVWLTSFKELKKKIKPKNWTTDPLSVPWVFLMVGMVCLMHLFLVLNPAVGLFLGIIPWLIIPLLFVLIYSSTYAKLPPWVKVLTVSLLIGLITVLMIFMIVLT